MHGTFKYLHKYFGYQPEVTFFFRAQPGDYLCEKRKSPELHKNQPFFKPLSPRDREKVFCTRINPSEKRKSERKKWKKKSEKRKSPAAQKSTLF